MLVLGMIGFGIAREHCAIRSDAAYVPVAFAIEAATHQAFGVGLHLAKAPRHRGTERIPAKWRVIARSAASPMSFRQRETRAQAAISDFAE